MKLQELLDFLNNSIFLNQIETTSIPNINLYMDQVLTFMNENLEHLKRNPNDKILTKSMINNYVKNDIIPKPENKKYFPNHIIYLIYILSLKQIVSLEDTQTLLKKYTHEHSDIKDMTDLYNNFLAIEKNDEDRLVKEIEDLAENLFTDNPFENFDDDEIMFLFILLLSSRANYYKIIVEKLIDNNFNKKEIKSSVKDKIKKP